MASAETVSAALLARLEERAGDAGVVLAITRRRAQILGLHSSKAVDDWQSAPVLLRLRAPVSLEVVRLLAGVDAAAAASMRTTQRIRSHIEPVERNANPGICEIVAAPALELLKQARLVPAMLIVATEPPPAAEGILDIDVSDFAQSAYRHGVDLERVSEARVPLSHHDNCRLVLFRDTSDASEHVAILIGSTDAAVVPVRVHSSCLTGDLLGSLRCDCGDQLRGAVEELAALGGGVLLYLAQEGRGIGLANKLRAYELQDAGFNTIEADRNLGFNDDERSYGVAADMLRQLGMTRVHLLTNNPAKIAALQEEDIEVVTDQRLVGALNHHNARYLRTKREHAGHLLPDIQLEEFR